MKLFRVPKMTFNGHPRPSAMPSVARSPGLPIRDRKIKLHLLTYFQTEIADRSRLLPAVQFNTVSEILNVK